MKKLYVILTLIVLVIGVSGLMIGLKNDDPVTGHTTAEMNFFQKLFGIKVTSVATENSLPNRDAEMDNPNNPDLPNNNDAEVDNPNNPDLPGEDLEETCKIVNTFNHDLESTLNDICQEEGLECKGVEFLKTIKLYNNEGKIQFEDKNHKWLQESPNCGFRIEPVSQNQEMPTSLYSEPYAGPILIQTEPTAALCC
ncbi:MAG: hypothetical protein KKA65_02235 [Nanoarchaeota archaeon]|nr:hypothetical protein [Nanoarchaeota archaeon]MBU4351479.1 hypothetical protein [Nanoarchaeota archaeon]MBU4456295.1 hypothetical protein [Nanoarchaeota archaeon]MCG2720145.1 hypothetical protein [Nanoarchaeota archaeon]